MNNNTIDYLDSYVQQLDLVRTPADVYGRLSDWHVDTRQALAAAVEDINASLHLAGPYALQTHMATTAIGRLDGEIVVVSANPGFSAGPNALEDAYRGQGAAQNRAFSEGFFSEYPRVCATYSPYWRMVMRLYEHYAGEAAAPDTPALWARMADRPQIGGIDLLPFHSTKDGITPFLMGPGADPHLRRVALATLAMAIRLSPGVLLVTSRPGQTLIASLFAQQDPDQPHVQARVLAPDAAWPAPYHLIQAWEATVPGGATRIVSFPYQVFSGSFRARQFGYEPKGFAERIRDLATR
jgi:hypothetical protein